MARRFRQLVPLLWQRELGIRRAWPHAPPHRLDQRPADHRFRAQLPLAGAGAASQGSCGTERARALATKSQDNECEEALNSDQLIFHFVAQLMPNTLGLDDDLEPVEVVRHLERIFDIRVSNDEAESIVNVGAFYDLLLDKIPSNDADRKCASAMTFYRIRSALRTLGYGDGLTLASDIHGLERGRTKKNLRDVGRESGLRMPETVPTRIGRVGSLCDRE